MESQISSKVLDAFDKHVAGDVVAAYKQYAEVLAETPGDPFALFLQNAISMQVYTQRKTKKGALLNLKSCGFNPATVIDVGAQVGTPELFEVFPDAHHVLIEPVREHEPVLKGICQRLKSAEYMMAAVSARSGSAILSVTENLQFATIDRQLSDSSNNRVIETISLNQFCATRSFASPFLVKIDVDGVEVEVLKGATSLISDDSVFVLEASLLDGVPRFARIVEFFKPFGFVVHDIVDHLYRPMDNTLWQVDVVMVSEAHPMRKSRNFIEN